MKHINLAWRVPQSNIDWTIGRLTYEDGIYQFRYLQGVKSAQKYGFKKIWSFPDLDKIYQSKYLFGIFSNRIMKPSRPDYPNYLHWLNLSFDRADPMMILARDNGTSATNNFLTFANPEPMNNQSYRFYFYMDHIDLLTPVKPFHLFKELVNIGDKLQLLPIPNNNYQLTVNTEKGDWLGYCPSYLAQDLLKGAVEIEIKCIAINPPPAPLDFRMLCQLIARYPLSYQPFSDAMFLPYS